MPKRSTLFAVHRMGHLIGGADGGHADEGVVFHGLALPAVVHEETRAVDTENASVKASVEVRLLLFNSI